MRKAINVLNVMNFSDEERELYEGQLKWLRIETNTLKKYGEKGRKLGREEGRREEKYEIARSLLKQGLDPSQIAKATGLPEEEILSLSKK